MMYGWSTGMGWGMGGGLLSLLIIAGTAVGIVFLVRWLVSKNRDKKEQSAVEILKSRYARGEISRDEYRLQKSDLEEE